MIFGLWNFRTYDLISFTLKEKNTPWLKIAVTIKINLNVYREYCKYIDSFSKTNAKFCHGINIYLSPPCRCYRCRCNWDNCNYPRRTSEAIIIFPSAHYYSSLFFSSTGLPDTQPDGTKNYRYARNILFSLNDKVFIWKMTIRFPPLCFHLLTSRFPNEPSLSCN